MSNNKQRIKSLMHTTAVFAVASLPVTTAVLRLKSPNIWYRDTHLIFAAIFRYNSTLVAIGAVFLAVLNIFGNSESDTKKDDSRWAIATVAMVALVALVYQLLAVFLE